MWKDPIVEEVRAARDAYARRFGYDLKKIAADLIKRQAEPKQKQTARAKAAKRKSARPSPRNRK